MKLAYDAAYPVPGGVPGTDTVLIYIGGDTPHEWLDSEIAAQPERWRVPTFVQSFAGDGAADAEAAVAWLVSHTVPTGTTIVYDIETLIDPAMVAAFGAGVNANGFGVLVYGSSGNVMQNPPLQGYFVADPGATALYPGAVATQFGYYGSYDLSWISDVVVLWDTFKPVPPPVGPPVVTGDDVTAIEIPVFTTDANGWTAVGVALPPGKTNHDIVSVVCDAASAYDPQGWHFCNGAPDFDKPGVIVFKSLLPNDSFSARVFVTG